MTVELTPEMETIVSNRLSSGRYSSAQAVLAEAFSALQLQESMRDSSAPADAAHGAAFPMLSQEERDERARKMDVLFARIDAEGGFDFDVERDRTPPRSVELW